MISLKYVLTIYQKEYMTEYDLQAYGYIDE